MSDVTDADREKARELVVYADPDTVVEAVAVALAEEREKARAPFLALADELEAESNRAALLTSMAAVVATRVNRETAASIRRAIEGTP